MFFCVWFCTLGRVPLTPLRIFGRCQFDECMQSWGCDGSRSGHLQGLGGQLMRRPGNLVCDIFWREPSKRNTSRTHNVTPNEVSDCSCSGCTHIGPTDHWWCCQWWHPDLRCAQVSAGCDRCVVASRHSRPTNGTLFFWWLRASLVTGCVLPVFLVDDGMLIAFTHTAHCLPGATPKCAPERRRMWRHVSFLSCFQVNLWPSPPFRLWPLLATFLRGLYAAVEVCGMFHTLWDECCGLETDLRDSLLLLRVVVVGTLIGFHCCFLVTSQ